LKFRRAEKEVRVTYNEGQKSEKTKTIRKVDEESEMCFRVVSLNATHSGHYKPTSAQQLPKILLNAEKPGCVFFVLDERRPGGRFCDVSVWPLFNLWLAEVWGKLKNSLQKDGRKKRKHRKNIQQRKCFVSQN
jgi:hypothetical protein